MGVHTATEHMPTPHADSSTQKLQVSLYWPLARRKQLLTHGTRPSRRDIHRSRWGICSSRQHDKAARRGNTSLNWRCGPHGTWRKVIHYGEQCDKAAESNSFIEKRTSRISLQDEYERMAQKARFCSGGDDAFARRQTSHGRSSTCEYVQVIKKRQAVASYATD